MIFRQSVPVMPNSRVTEWPSVFVDDCDVMGLPWGVDSSVDADLILVVGAHQWCPSLDRYGHAPVGRADSTSTRLPRSNS